VDIFVVPNLERKKANDTDIVPDSWMLTSICVTKHQTTGIKPERESHDHHKRGGEYGKV